VVLRDQGPGDFRDRPAAMPDMTGSARPISAPCTRTTAGPPPDWSKTMTVPSAEVTVPVRMPLMFRPRLSQLAGSLRHSTSQWCPSGSVKPRW
jgi:hypothetical protein